MYVTVDVELDEFDTDDIVGYLESLGYTVTKDTDCRKDSGEPVQVLFTDSDIFHIKNLHSRQAKDLIINTVCRGLSLGYLEDELCRS